LKKKTEKKPLDFIESGQKEREGKNIFVKHVL